MASPSLEHDLTAELDAHRRELIGYCYRMLGSSFEAEDAVQEAMIRAWRNIDGFEGRSSLRSWLYRIATNVCVDMLRGPQRRARPMDLGPSSTADTAISAPTEENVWITPIADARVVPADGDPASLAAARESIRLAFIAALQVLPPRQRAVLILREVLAWQASEVGELLELSVPSVNSLLQRARATIAERGVDRDATTTTPTADQRELLDRYVDAFERYDVAALVALLHDDAIMSMPPFALWLQGSDQIAAWFVGQGAGCRGSRLVATAANGCAAFGSYRPDPDGGHSPWGVHVIEVRDGRISAQHSFLGAAVFPQFGLPDRLPPRDS